MNLENRVNALRDKHSTLERRIEKELSHPAWDEFQVRRLKREKLTVKEEIERLLRDAA